MAGSAGADEAADEVSYVADLQGYSQTPRMTTTASGTATLKLSADKKTLSYHITQNVVNATKAHIHFGAAGENGAVVYPLEPLSGEMSGSISLVNATDVANLEDGELYINVHSATSGDGEIRGQILHPDETLYVATLTPGQETPPSDATTSGTAQIIVDAAKAGFRFHVQSSIATPTAAHIHRGIATYAGPHVHVFVPAPTIDGTDTFAAGEMDDLIQGRWYINVHTAANPNGEIRGQVLRPGEALYSAALADSNEAPPVASGATGNSQFILAPDQKSLRYEVALLGITPTMAHIHKGAAGVSGPVVYPLTLVPGYSYTPNATGGGLGVQPITPTDLGDLNAGSWYVNAHAAAFPAGADRGQIK